MNITTLQFDPLDVLSQSDQMYPRTTGQGVVHVSQIYGDIRNELEKRNRPKLEQSELNNYRTMGFLFEHFLSSAMAEAIGYSGWFRPGEVTCDGITGSPDLLDPSTGELGECKATYRSFNRMGADAGGLRGDFWIWDVQMRSYCRMCDTRACTLFGLWVNGDYTTYQPKFASWKIEYTTQEIEENWRMLTNHARHKGWI